MTGPTDLPPIGVPPEDAIAFFRAKGYRIGFNWQDVFKAEHVRWFTVAKAMSRDLLEDIRAEVDRAIVDGTTLEDFRKTLRPRLEARGWWGRRTMIDPATGMRETVQLGSPKRLKTIFDTNVRTAYAAGKWARIDRVKTAFPFLEYTSLMDGRERPEHHDWNGTILPVEDPWWDTHYPPCDWNCRCDVIPRTQRMLDRKGLSITPPKRFPDEAWVNKRTGETGVTERGVGKGWDYNVGKEYLRGLAPPPLPESFDGPDQVDAAARIGTDQARRIDAFLKGFGIAAGAAAIWTDRDGWPLSIGRGWFIGRDGAARVPGAAALVAIGRALRNPDTIRWVWVRGADDRALLMRRYARGPIEVDVGREGWRWRSIEHSISAAYNPGQPRDAKGRWTSGGGFAKRLRGSVTSLSAPLTPDEHHAIREYTATAYHALNERLRGRPFDDYHDDWRDHDDLDNLEWHLDRAIAKSVLTHDMKLYRGVKRDAAIDLERADLRLGSVFYDPAYASTSKNARFAWKWHADDDPRYFLKIHAPKGISALDVTAVSSAGTGERELLLPRRTSFQVEGYVEATRTFSVKIIGQGDAD